MANTNLDGLVLDSSLAVGGNVTVIGTITGRIPFVLGSADGAISLKDGVVFITKAGVAVLTLADPTDVTDDGKVLHFISKTANAHTVTIAGGLNGAGSGADVGTFGAAVGNRFSVIAHGGKWWSYGVNVGVTFA